MDNKDVYNDYSDLDFSDLNYEEVEFDEEALQEQLFFAKDEYEQWTRDMDIARDYACGLDQMNKEKYNDVDKMRELVGKDDYKLVSILDQKESLLDRMQEENAEFIEKIDYECKTKGKQHEKRIERLYEKLKRNGV